MSNRPEMLDTIAQAKRDTLERWAFGGFVALVIAMFVGVLMQKINSFRQTEASLAVYGVTLLISSIAALIYYNWGSAAPNSLGKIMLALTYSTIAVVIFRALDEISHDYRDVLKTTLAHALTLAIVMAVLQIAITLSFSCSRPNAQCGGMDWLLTRLAAPDGHLLYLGLIGFVKGFCLGGLITYLIQDSLRRQQLVALRRTPRARFNNIVTLELEGNERRVDTRNISKLGTLIKCDCDLTPGDQVSISAPFLGSIKGIIRWTKPQQLGKQLTGIEFTETKPELDSFLRQQYGEFYA